MDSGNNNNNNGDSRRGQQQEGAKTGCSFSKAGKGFRLTSQGYSIRQIAGILQVGHTTVGNDYLFLRQQASENIREYIDKRLPEEYDKVLTGLTTILREAWTAAHKTEDTKEKISALSLAKEVYSTKLDLLTNADVVSHAVKFIEVHKNSNNNIKINGKVDKADSELLHDDNDAVTTNNTTTNKVF